MLKLTNECANQLLEILHEYAEKEAAFEFTEYVVISITISLTRFM